MEMTIFLSMRSTSSKAYLALRIRLMRICNTLCRSTRIAGTSEKCRGLCQLRRLGATKPLHDEAGGNIYAVEHVTDIVQDAGRYFRHASETRSFEQLLLRKTQRFLCFAVLRHVA